MCNYFKFNYLFLLFISIIFSVEDNYFSIKHSVSSYWKIMPNITDPFDIEKKKHRAAILMKQITDEKGLHDTDYRHPSVFIETKNLNTSIMGDVASAL